MNTQERRRIEVKADMSRWNLNRHHIKSTLAIGEFCIAGRQKMTPLEKGTYALARAISVVHIDREGDSHAN